MAERANFQTNYLMRYAIMAGICWLLALWFAYDGFIGYPAKIPPAEAYDELREINDDEERIERWSTLVEENNWPSDMPEETADEIRNSIVEQFVFTGLCLLGGIPALIFLLKSRGSWVESTETGLTTSWGQSVDFQQVTRLNKKRWAQKGTARAFYKDNGSNKAFVFDDFKFEREPIGKMLRRLESTLDREQIVGGPTEAENDARKKTLEAESISPDENTSQNSEDPQR